MSDFYQTIPLVEDAPRRPRQRWLLHIALFLLSFVTCTMAGTQWIGHDPFDVANWTYGLTYASLILLFLASHEFGHFFAAKIHGVDATLPFFIPMPSILSPFGTMGAVIKTRSQIPSRKVMFDIGVAGPISGFIMCLGILGWGFTHLPTRADLYLIHPEYAHFPDVPTYGMTFGRTALYILFEKVFGGGHWMPPMNEIYHFPFLCVGWFGMFVTSLNLMPVGQLDGGHLTFGMFGSKHLSISRAFFVVALVLGALGMYDFAIMNGWIGGTPLWIGWSGWLFWALFIAFIIKLRHPMVPDMTPLDARRRLIGWATIGIFIVSFAPMGIFEMPADPRFPGQNPDKPSVPVQLHQVVPMHLPLLSPVVMHAPVVLPSRHA